MRITLWLALVVIAVWEMQDSQTRPREVTRTGTPTPVSQPSNPVHKQIAGRFAPIFYQGLGESPRSDYITNFDFDGDWKGDNNWWNLDNRAFPLRAYLYYSLTETTTHYFIHYALFHPRDYKGGLVKSAVLETLMGEGLRRLGKDPTGGLADDVALSHENDLEGCLVVLAKNGKELTVQFVETMAHNRYLKYCPGTGQKDVCEAIEMDGERPLIFVEPKGHGPSRYTGDRQQLKNAVNGVLVYRYTGQAEDHDKITGKFIGYDLQAVYGTLWARAQGSENETYGETQDYQTRAFFVLQADKSSAKTELKLGALGSAFRGTVGFKNKARPPWGWFDSSEKDRPLGEWFFDPAAVVARHFNLGQDFATAYIYNPYFKIGQ